MISDRSLSNRIILLNGMSCAGKSSIAPEIKRQIIEQHNKPAVTIEIDNYWRQLGTSFDNSLENMATAMHHDIARHHAVGNIVVVDHVFYDDILYINFLQHLKDLPIFFVKVFCNDEVAEKRLIARNDSNNVKEHRPSDILERDKKGPIHKNKKYDFAIDTSYTHASEAAVAILNHYLALPQKHVGVQRDNIALVFQELFSAKPTFAKV